MSNTTMLAYSIEKPGDTGQVLEVPLPVPEGPGFALIRVLVSSSLCCLLFCCCHRLFFVGSK